MPAGDREFKEDLSPDKTPINSYSIKLSERDAKALERLKKEAALLGANGIVIQNIATNIKQHLSLNENDKGEINASSRHEKQKELNAVAIFVK